MQFQLSGRHHDVDAITSAVRSLDAGAKVMLDPARNHLKVFASASAEQIMVKLRELGFDAQPFAHDLAGGCGSDGCDCG
jgi:hypothetical protein